MLIKEQVEEALHNMPNQFNVDEIVDKLILLDKIRQGLQDSSEGKLYTEEEATKNDQKMVKLKNIEILTIHHSARFFDLE